DDPEVVADGAPEAFRLLEGEQVERVVVAVAPELPRQAEDVRPEPLLVGRGPRVASVGAHMRNTPNVVSGIGAWSAAASPSASTRRVSSGSMIPSSQSRAVE